MHAIFIYKPVQLKPDAGESESKHGSEMRNGVAQYFEPFPFLLFFSSIGTADLWQTGMRHTHAV